MHSSRRLSVFTGKPFANSHISDFIYSPNELARCLYALKKCFVTGRQYRLFFMVGSTYFICTLAKLNNLVQANIKLWRRIK